MINVHVASINDYIEKEQVIPALGLPIGGISYDIIVTRFSM